MTIEINSVELSSSGIVKINAVDCSEINLQRIERNRDDGGFAQEVQFVFDTKDKNTFLYLRKFLKKQKATRGCSTYGDALQSIVGTITTISSFYKYRTWD